MSTFDFVYDSVKKSLNVPIVQLLRPVSTAFPSHLALEWINNLELVYSRESEFIKHYLDHTRDDKQLLFSGITLSMRDHLRQIRSTYGAMNRASLLIAGFTVESYSHALGPFTWTDEFSEFVPDDENLNKNDPIELLATVLIDYYVKVGRKERKSVQDSGDEDEISVHIPSAHSLAFWYICKAFLLNPDLANIFDQTKELNQYFRLLKSYFNGEQLPSKRTIGAHNKFFKYLEDRIENASPLSMGDGYSVQDARPSVFYFERQNPFTLAKKKQKIIVIGESRSGKTTFIKELSEASKDSNGNIGHYWFLTPYQNENTKELGRYWTSTNELPPETIEESIALRGSYNSFETKDLDVVLYDHKGGILMDQAPSSPELQPEDMNILEQLCHGCDMLIIAIHPELVMSEEKRLNNVLNRMYHYVRLAVITNPDVVISIMYTMCDDYGTLIEGPRRVVHNAAIAKALYHCRIASHTEKQRVLDGFLQMASGLDKNKADDWSILKYFLLSSTSLLWERIVHNDGLNHVSVNGYFVSSFPPDQYDYTVDYAKKGILEIISDFVHFMNPPLPPTLYSKTDIENRRVFLSWTLDGPSVTQYRLYKTDDRDKLFKPGINYFSTEDIDLDQFEISNLKPKDIINIEKDPEISLPILPELSWVDERVALNRTFYYQVVVFDEFNNFNFSNIIENKIEGDYSIWDLFKPRQKKISSEKPIFFSIVIILVVILVAYMIAISPG